MSAAAAHGHLPVLQLLGACLPASSTRAVLLPPRGPLEAAIEHGHLPALTYLMDELCPQLDLPQLLTLAQHHEHVQRYLQQRLQDVLLSASAMLAGTAHAWLPPGSLSRSSSLSLPARLTDDTGTRAPSLSSSGTPTHALNVAAPPFVPSSPGAASIASPTLGRVGSTALQRGCLVDGNTEWSLVDPVEPTMLPPLFTPSWAHVVQQPGSLKYSPPREVYALACKPRQLQHVVQATKLDVNSVSNGMSAMTLACRYDCGNDAIPTIFLVPETPTAPPCASCWLQAPAQWSWTAACCCGWQSTPPTRCPPRWWPAPRW